MASTPPLCPRPSIFDLPNMTRDIPALLFLPACLPGSETTTGCPADKAFYTVAVPWNRFATEGWTSPSGNQYWSETIIADPRNPKAKQILRVMAARSREHFQSAFGKSTQKMGALLQATGGKLAAHYGVVTVEVTPDPNETAAAYTQRGGYLLWIDPASGPFHDKMALQAYHATWMGNAIKQAELWADYDPTTSKISYSIRLIQEGSWTKTATAVGSWIEKNSAKFCSQIGGAKMASAAAAMSAFPGTAPYLAAYGAALSLCNVPWTPPPCIPQAPLPGQMIYPSGSPTGTGPAIQSVKSGTIWAQGGFAPTSAAAVAPLPGQLPPAIPGAYPDGTIAWYDDSAKGYRIAVPFPGSGTTHAIVSAAAVPTLPATGIRLVTKGEWERATLPWLRRSSTKIGMMIGGIAAASAATLYVSRQHG